MNDRDPSCKEPKEHLLHLCELKAKPNNPELAKLYENPQYVCANCGGRVSRAHNLCAPKPLEL